MTYQDKVLLRDSKSQPIAQQFDYIQDDFSALYERKSGMISPITHPTELTIPTYDGSGQATHPSVLHFPDGYAGYKFWMAFTPYPNFDTTVENPSVLASNDGVTWVLPAGASNPIEPAPGAGFYADTSLVYDGGKLLVYWAHSSANVTYRRTSTNGVTWTDKEAVTHLQGGDVRFISTGRWESWNLSKDGELVRRVSTDGLVFSNPLRVPTNLIGKMGHVMVYHDASGYHFTAVSSPTNKSTLDAEIYYGYSETGSSVFFDTVPILKPTAGKWYSSALYTTSMCHIGKDIYRLYISGFANSVSKIGYMDIKRERLVQAVTTIGSKAHQTKRVLLFAAHEVRTDVLTYAPLLGSTGVIPDFNDYPNKTITFYNTHDKAVILRFVTSFYGFNLNTFDGLPTQVMQQISIPAGAGLFRINILDEGDLAILGKMYAGDVRVGILGTAGDLPTAGNITMEITMWA